MTAPLYEIRNVSKSFGQVMADQVTELVRREPGHLGLAPHRRSGSANTSIAFERYADAKAVDTHVTAQRTTALNIELASLVEGRGPLLSWLEPW